MSEDLAHPASGCRPCHALCDPSPRVLSGLLSPLAGCRRVLYWPSEGGGGGCVVREECLKGQRYHSIYIGFTLHIVAVTALNVIVEKRLIQSGIAISVAMLHQVGHG